MTGLGRCRPSPPVPVLVIHGSAGRNLPIDGGVGAKAFPVRGVRGVASGVDFWRRHDGSPRTNGWQCTAPFAGQAMRSAAEAKSSS